MKFGKQLQQVIDASNPQWGPFWINYKSLKKQIKAVVEANKAHQKDGNVALQSIDQCSEEVAFFTSLRNELRKLSMFFSSEEKRYLFRFQQLSVAWQEMKKDKAHDEIQTKRMMGALVHFYRECIMLENFAISNYSGFSKILKKHDKMTGHDTKIKYMRKMVNQSPFADYPQLIQMLKNTEDIFTQITGNTEMAIAAQEATKLQRAEVAIAIPRKSSETEEEDIDMCTE